MIFKDKLFVLSLALLALNSSACRPEVAEEPLAREPLCLTAKVDNASPSTNDTILYTVTVDYDDRLNVTIPEFGAKIAGLRVTDAGKEPAQKMAGRTMIDYWYKLRADISGAYMVPAMEISYMRPDWYSADGASDGATDAAILTAKTAEIYLNVASRVTEGADGSSLVLRDIKPLPEVPGKFPWLLLLLLLLAALAVMVVYFLKKKKDANEYVRRPAHEIAYDRLAKLVDTPLADEKCQRDFFFKLSYVLKEYLENRFAINATDKTTEELAAVLYKVTTLDDLHSRAAINMLRAFDRVKYAGILLQKADGNEELAEVKRFVDDTRELTAEPEPEED